MMKPVLTLFILFFALHSMAQVPDFISVKKRSGITVKNYYAGSPISFITQGNREYNGLIDKIENDSLTISIFQVNVYQTIWQTYVRDTVNVFHVPFHYKSIKRIQVDEVMHKQKHSRFLSALMMIGSAGYILLNIVNSGQAHYSITSSKNLTNLGVAAALFGGGYYLNRKSNPNAGSAKKYKIMYVDMH